MSTLTEEYLDFRSSVSQKKICIGDDQTWTLYDAGPRSVTSPIIFLPPASGRADVFFMQLSCLSKHGYRAISIEYPVLWTVRDFCLCFNRLLNALQLEKVHLFGSAIGGFLALKYAQFSKSAKRVQSVILCNSFTDSSIFVSRFPAIPPAIFWVLPSVVLRKMVMGDFKELHSRDQRTRYSADFMRHSLDSLRQEELASRLVLNCTDDYVQPQYLRNVSIMIIEVNDCEALDQVVMEETSKCFPDARVAHLKSGGNFPFISRCDDINIFIQIHLKPYLTIKECSPIGQDNILTTLVKEAEALVSPELTPSSQEGERRPTDASVDNLPTNLERNVGHQGGPSSGYSEVKMVNPYVENEGEKSEVQPSVTVLA